MKRIGILMVALTIGVAGLAQAEESLGDKIKKVFAPTPTPTPHKHHKTSSATKTKVTAEKSPTPTPKPKPTATPDETPTPSPHRKKKSASKHNESSESESSPSPAKNKHHPSPSPTPAESPSPTPSASVEETPQPSPSPTEKKKGSPVTISSSQIAGFENYPAPIQKIIELSLGLAGQNLDYKYGSADPSNGGMDCSGFISYVLSQSGLREVPRDASEQYVWVRKSGKFQAVVSRHDDTFELNELKPGDLLFWTGTYSVERDPPITHAMIYLGREKGTNHRVMVGASDGRTYKGESRYGVSVFDFKVAHSASSSNADGRVPTFVGYGPIPGL